MPPESWCGYCFKTRSGFLPFQLLVGEENLIELPLHGENGVQGGHRLLKNHRNLIAADFVHFLFGALGQVLAFKEDLAAVDIAVSVQELQNAHGGNALAAAAFPHDSQGPAGLHLVGNAVYGFDDALLGFKEGVQVAQFQ